MKAILLLSALIVSTTWGEDLRTFTNKEGDTIQARMVRLEGDVAVIQRDDREIFRVAIDSMSEEDQLFMRRWPVINAVSNEREVEIRTRRSRLARVVEDENPAFDHVVSYRGIRQEFVYQIIFNNRAPLDLTDMTVEYRIFKDLAQHDAVSYQAPGYPPERVARTGTVKLERAPFREETILETEPFFLVETIREEWGPYDPYLDRHPIIEIKREDVLHGIWIRVMEGDKVVREQVSSPNIPRRFSWD